MRRVWNDFNSPHALSSYNLKDAAQHRVQMRLLCITGGHCAVLELIDLFLIYYFHCSQNREQPSGFANYPSPCIQLLEREGEQKSTKNKKQEQRDSMFMIRGLA